MGEDENRREGQHTMAEVNRREGQRTVAEVNRALVRVVLAWQAELSRASSISCQVIQ